MRKKTVKIISSLVMIGAVNGFGITSEAAEKLLDGASTPPTAVQESYKNIGMIVTSHGEFVRVDQAPEVSDGEIATNHKKTNEKTNVLMLDYGVFLKK